MCHCLAYQPPLIFVNVLERARALYRNAVRSGNKGRIYTTDRRLKQTARTLYNLAWKETRRGNTSITPAENPCWERVTLAYRYRRDSFSGIVRLLRNEADYVFNWKRKGVTFVVMHNGIYLYKAGVCLNDNAPIGRRHDMGLFREIMAGKLLLEIMPDVTYARRIEWTDGTLTRR